MNPAIAAFNRYAGEYDRWFDEHPQAYGEQIAVLRSAVPQGGTGLEVGVGSGRYASRLGIRHGLDPSPDLLKMAYRRGVASVLGTGEALPYRAGSFDYVLMMTVICFMDDIVHPFREADRVLARGGIIIVGFFEKGGETARQEREGKSPGQFLRYAKFRSIDEVSVALAAAGFSGYDRVDTLHGFCIVTGQKG
jgi:ubiquinone/menaquinone biosynthesis C-methylase UbiE